MNLKSSPRPIAYRTIAVCLVFVLGLFLCQSCSKEDTHVNIIRVKVETNSDEPVRIYGITDSGETGVVIKNNYETTFELGNDLHDGFSIEARCQDGNTFITMTVWVNGILKSKVSGNKYLTSGDISLL